MMSWMCDCSLLACPNRAASCNCDPHIKRMFCVTQWYLITSVLIPRCRQECCHTCWPSRHWDELEASLFRPSEQFFFNFSFSVLMWRIFQLKKGDLTTHHSRNSLSGSRHQLQPTTLMCATRIHSGDTRTYVSVGELTTPTMPMGNIGILISVVPVIRTRVSE